MKQWAHIFCAIAALSSVSPAQAEDVEQPLSLAPSSKWVLDYADDSCALRRTFGDDGQKVFLELRQFAPDNKLQIVVTSDDINYRKRPTYLQFLPDPAEAEPRYHGNHERKLGKGILAQFLHAHRSTGRGD